MNFQPIHLERPAGSITHLMDTIRPFATPYELPRCRFVDIPEDEIWLVDSGMASIYREQGKQLIFISAPPFIMGVKNIFFQPTEIYTAEFRGTETIWRIPVVRFTELVEQHALWKEVAHLLAFYFITAMENTFRLIKRSDYETIKALILEYAFLPDCAKSNISLTKYIVEKGMISRSNTMRILSLLNKYGYVTITRGRLMKIDYLPATL